jgi:hypothetical protein
LFRKLFDIVEEMDHVFELTTAELGSESPLKLKKVGFVKFDFPVFSRFIEGFPTVFNSWVMIWRVALVSITKGNTSHWNSVGGLEKRTGPNFFATTLGREYQNKYSNTKWWCRNTPVLVPVLFLIMKKEER